MEAHTDLTNQAEPSPQKQAQKPTKKETLSKADKQGMFAATLAMLTSNGTNIVATDNKGFINGKLEAGLWVFIPHWSLSELEAE